MLRNKPKLKYCGLTVVLSNPSRFDRVSLLSATGGHVFNDHCLRPEFNVMQCDIRVADDKSPLLEGTKCVMLLGESAMHSWIPQTRNNSLGEMRGSVFVMNGVAHIASFFPQDAADSRAYEQQLNPLSKDYMVDGDGPDDTETFDSVKRHGSTKRGNYAFWIRADSRKAKAIIAAGGVVPASEFPQPQYRIYPSVDEVVSVLQATTGQFLYFDIETDYEEQNLQCFSFSFDGKNIYSVPVLDYNYKWAYSGLHFILRALAVAISRNTIVAHNGAAFDFFVLAHKYHIPVGSCYDTMLAMHRCFPDIEKSLGHCTSYWTWEKFHKDEDSQGYNTQQQMNDRLRYCGKDVYTMFLIHQAITKYARTIPGLEHSISVAMDSIRPYLITTLLGIRVDTDKVIKSARENDALMTQYDRIIKWFIGPSGLHEVQGGKKSFFAGSNKQCCKYFHDMLGYPVMARSMKTQEPSLAKKAMFKLALKHENPVIQLSLAYREVAKEYGTYKFTPWITDDGKHGIKTILEYGNDIHTAEGDGSVSDELPA